MSGYSALHRVTGRHGWKALPRLTSPSIPEFGPTNGAQWVRDNAGPRESVSVFSGTAGVDYTALSPSNTQSQNQTAITNDTTGKVWWPAGVYRLTSTFTLKANTEYRFATGPLRTSADTAIVKGSALVTTWVSDGAGRWSATGQTQDFSGNSAAILGGSNNAANPVASNELEDYYLDGVPMIAVTSKAAVTIGSNKKYMDRANDTVWIGVDPAGRTLERLMFMDHLLLSGSPGNVTVKGGIFEHHGYSALSHTHDGLVLEDAEMRYGHLRSGVNINNGLSTYRTGIQIRYCHMHHGGRYNHNIIWTDGAIVEHNEFAAGNDLHFSNTRTTTTGAPVDEGASKSLHVLNMIWRYNYSHGSDGSEWWDTDCGGTIIEESVFEDSYQFGVFFEDNNTGTIRRNYFRDCGMTEPTFGAWALGHHMGDLYVSTSANVEVTRNILEVTPAVTYAFDCNLRLSYQPNRNEDLINLWVHHNQFLRTRSAAAGRGFFSTRGSTGAGNEVRQIVSNNKYDSNEYHVPTGSADSTWWHWNGGDDETWTTWRLGDTSPLAPASFYDPNGSFTADL